MQPEPSPCCICIGLLCTGIGHMVSFLCPFVVYAIINVSFVVPCSYTAGTRTTSRWRCSAMRSSAAGGLHNCWTTHAKPLQVGAERVIVLFWCFCRRCGSSSTEPRHAASFAVPILVVCHLLLALAICPFADEPVHANTRAPPPKCQPSPNSVSSWRSAATKQGVQCMHIACSTTTVR